MKREYLDYLEDIVAAVDNAVKFIKGMAYKEFIKDDKTAYAVIRAIEIIGEAAKNIPASVKTKYPDIPWKEMTGMRDKLIHEYFGVKPDIVWDTVKNEIPKLRSRFMQIIDEIQNESITRNQANPEYKKKITIRNKKKKLDKF